ncbi:MAG: hypothetical protein QOG52_1837, partial [Frankiaceae bacterium]|nr:hypothetical protein [Frankiaceae bacterium]
RRTLVNALIDERRRPFWRRESSHALVPDGAAPPSDGDHSQLRAALAELPPGMRAVVVFRYVYDLSVADTADALKCSEGNVKSQTARGLERLRELLPPLTEAAPREMPSGPAAESPRQPLNRPHLPTASLTIPRSSS